MRYRQNPLQSILGGIQVKTEMDHKSQDRCVPILLIYNAGQNNLAKTSNCMIVGRKGDFSDLPFPPISMLLLRCLLSRENLNSEFSP